MVIGSNSFSGSHFVEECINAGHETWGVSRSAEPSDVFLPYKWRKEANRQIGNWEARYNFHQFDMNKDIEKILTLIEHIEPEIIVNFAAQGMVAESWKQPIDWYETNLIANVKLTSELKEKDYLKKYVQISTPEVYGSTGDDWKDESLGFNPSTPYAVSKAACDMHLKCLYETYGFPAIYTRAANVYGPGQQLYRIIPRAIISAIGNRNMVLDGGGVTKRSFIHIKDVTRATLALALNANPGTTWHISTKSDISIHDLVKYIFDACGGNFNKYVEIGEERKSKDGRYRLNSERLRETFQWEDRISLEEGINETIDWVRENWDSIKHMNTKYTHKK